MTHGFKFKEKFSGTQSESAEGFLTRFDAWCDIQGYNDTSKCNYILFHLDGQAFESWKNSSSTVKNNYQSLRTELLLHFGPVQLPADEQFEVVRSL